MLDIHHTHWGKERILNTKKLVVGIFPSFLKQIGLSTLLVLSAYYSFTQRNLWEPAYTNISVNDGLPSSEVYYVHEDRKGHMWFCTDHGVVKYDGFRLHLFDKSKGLPDNVIFKIYEDELGRVWFFAYNGTLAYYSPKEDRIIPYKYNNELAKLNHGDFNTIKDFLVDKENNVYYSGVYRSAKIDAKGRVKDLEMKGFRTYTDIRGTWFFWGSLKWEMLKSRKICLVPAKGKEKYYTHFEAVITCNLERINERDYLLVNDWVIDMDNLTNRAKFEGITGMYDVGGELWISTLFGAYRYKKQKGLDLTKPDACYLKNQQITSITKDHEGGYWFSTLDDGVYYTPNLEIVHWIPSNARNQNTIYCINGIKKEVYYASSFGYYNLRSGVQILEKKGGIHAIGVWDNKLVLLNNLVDKGINPFIKESWGYQLDGFAGWSVNKQGDFYGLYITLLKVDKQTKKHEVIIGGREVYNPKKYVPHFFKTLVHDDKGRMYAGSSTGLFKVNNKEFEKVKLPPDFSRVTITGLAFHKDWGVVIATKSKGLFFLKDGKVVRRIQLEDGLLSNQLNTLHIDKDGKIYVGTNKGVSKITKSKTNSISIVNLTKLTGLVSSEVNCIYTNKDGVYIGTRSGITLVPDSYVWNAGSFLGQIQIQSVFADGKQLANFRDGMEFNASQKVIRFLLQTTNYKSLRTQPYRYRFRNTDPWSAGNNGELILINPSFESYELEIQYENEVGLWSAPYILSRFSISPPFYSTWWFTGLIVLVILVVSFLFFRNRITVIHRRNKVQRDMELLEQKALLAQMNPHFIFNALNSIQSFLLYNENDLAERYLLKLSKLIRLTLTNSRETEISIQKEIDSLQMYLELEQMRFKNRFEFYFEISLSKEELNKFIPPMLIQPFAENAILHGFKGLEKGGRIDLNFKQINDVKLIVEVVDNGVGYIRSNPNVKDPGHKSYGTQITSERLSLFKERYQSEFDFSIESLKDENGNPKGTKVVISIPILVRD
ncbi:MAG: signal transduction histidine kinase, LytS [Fluviicola sp.]|jgi:ligand-binding sensor domain-containing protein|uniref:sensor histidine kinase n=1 Tax=Fluviicola sp. TaxID=1917219 RepID=UPI002631F0EA|nr:two-component regulator propeller domain-containing protein [Fluviicola sp.]MDF3028523.1 signal transduction histidine kinase, LytS [Fluviicola sp.]